MLVPPHDADRTPLPRRDACALPELRAMPISMPASGDWPNPCRRRPYVFYIQTN
eukprot:COSAG06_NODE_54482_length_294_cov_0.856410_1_plen_53_part_01